MIDTQTIEAIHAHIDECPTDWQARRELADLLEEAGREDEAQYQRWAAKHERSPIGIRDWPSLWQWLRTCHTPPEHPAVILSLYERLNSWYADWGYDSRRRAEADLLRVLVEQGWPAPGVE